MSPNKAFNAWIAFNFNGLSAHTLCQLLRMDGRDFLPVDYVQNMVYVDLYHVFTKSATETEQNSYNTCMGIVESCAWL